MSNTDKSLAIASEMDSIISEDDKLLGAIYRLKKQGVDNVIELTTLSKAANRGVVYNNLNILKSILDGSLPSSASISLHTIRAIDRLIRNSSPSIELMNYFENLKRQLQENSERPNTVNYDLEALDNSSKKLSKVAEKFENAIYVYSFPTYLHFGTIEDPEVFWFKIGSTRNSVWQRIIEQNRQTSMPEDPKLLRVYHKNGIDVSEYEKKFHDTLEKVGHERSSATRSRAGKEWFATTLSALDALASLMQLEIESEIQIN